MVRTILALGLHCCFCGCGQEGVAKPKSEFDAARNLAVTGKYSEAIPVLENFLKNHPGSVDASRAGLFLGKCHLALGDFASAKMAFQDTVNQYPGTLEAHKCRYKLALTAFLSGDDNALALFEQLANPASGPYAPEATAMVAYLKKQLPAEQNE